MNNYLQYEFSHFPLSVLTNMAVLWVMTDYVFENRRGNPESRNHALCNYYEMYNLNCLHLMCSYSYHQKL